MRNRCPPSRGIRRMLPPSWDWIAHLVRMSGKSVAARTSMTPHACIACSPTSLRPMHSRTLLRAPSAPSTYLARTVRSSPSPVPPCRRSLTTTGCSPGSLSRTSKSSSSSP